MNTLEYNTESQKKKFYRSKEWKRVRQQALDRDNRECQVCKRMGRVFLDSVKEPGKKKKVRLNVHHLKEIADYPGLALDLDNLETVCIKHHNKEHDRNFARRTKSIWNDEKW
ncbi:HNH endonuclease [Rossellomorea marisflavi]|uniref:HNH endonuclease n=1 Tax=Rossellomorea marisflavi TaxID=189381 RepID=UPI00345780F5